MLHSFPPSQQIWCYRHSSSDSAWAGYNGLWTMFPWKWIFKSNMWPLRKWVFNYMTDLYYFDFTEALLLMLNHCQSISPSIILITVYYYGRIFFLLDIIVLFTRISPENHIWNGVVCNNNEHERLSFVMVWPKDILDKNSHHCRNVK